MGFLRNRLREPSSWAGLATIAATIVQAWQSKDVGAIVASVAGAAAVLTPEQGAK